MANINSVKIGSTVYPIVSDSANKDGSGNTITSYYCTLSTAQTLTGAKTFSQPIGITTAAKIQYNSTDECLDFIFS
jgi:hypothetical protein